MEMFFSYVYFSISHPDILRFTRTVQPVAFECWTVLLVEMFPSRNTA